MASKNKPLPLHDNLRDLALLRASSVDLSDLVDDAAPLHSSGETEGVEESTIQSYTFVREARTMLRMHNSGEAQKQGEKIEKMQEELGDVLKSLSN